MTDFPTAAPTVRLASKGQLWTGRVLSAIPVLMLVGSGLAKLASAQPVIENMTTKFGYQAGVTPIIGAVEVACALIYAFPRTAYLGAILLTGFLGGAVATHVRVGDPAFPMPAVLGVLAWAGLYLRDGRLRDLAPLVRR